MFDYSSGNKLLTPDGHILADYSRFSSPRSSLGEGLSTDCEADVESNLSVVSGDLSGDGRNTLCRNSLTDSDWSHTDNEKNQRRTIEWKEISTERKIAFLIALTSLVLVITGIILFSTLDSDCVSSCEVPSQTAPLKSNWKRDLNASFSDSDMQFLDINGDGVRDYILLVWKCKNNSCSERASKTCRLPSDNAYLYYESRLIAISSKTGNILHSRPIPFYVQWMACTSSRDKHVSCFCAGASGMVAYINMSKDSVLSQKQVCNHIFSCRLIHNNNNNNADNLMTVLVCFCQWEENENVLYGLAIYYPDNVSVRSRNALFRGDLFSSGVTPNLQHLLLMKFNNETSLVISLQSPEGSCSLWIISYASIFNQLFNDYEQGLIHLKELMSQVCCALPPLTIDVDLDGITDLVAVSTDKSLLINYGQSDDVEQFVTQDKEDIISLKAIPHSKRPLILLIRKAQVGDCEGYSLEVINPNGNMTSSKIKIPGRPLVTYSDYSSQTLKLYIWLKNSNLESCKQESSKEKEIDTLKRSIETSSLAKEVTDEYKSSDHVQDSDQNTGQRSDVEPFSVLVSDTWPNEANDPPFYSEERFAYWKQLLTSTHQGISGRVKEEPLPETIQHLCIQIIRNLEELLEKQLDRMTGESDWENGRDGGFDILLKRFEVGDEMINRGLEVDNRKENDEYGRTEPYGDIYYLVISMILREVGHLQSIALLRHDFNPNHETLVKRLKEISGNNVQATKSNQHPLSRNWKKDFFKNDLVATSLRVKSARKELVSTPSSTDEDLCKSDYSLLRMTISKASYHLDDITKTLRKSLSGASSSKRSCQDLNNLNIRSMYVQGDSLFINSWLQMDNECRVRIFTIPIH